MNKIFGEVTILVFTFAIFCMVFNGENALAYVDEGWCFDPGDETIPPENDASQLLPAGVETDVTQGETEHQEVDDQETLAEVEDVINASGGDVDFDDEETNVVVVTDEDDDVFNSHIADTFTTDNGAFHNALVDSGITHNNLPVVEVGDIVVQTENDFYLLRQNDADELMMLYSDIEKVDEVNNRAQRDVSIYDEDDYDSEQRGGQKYSVGSDNDEPMLLVTEPDIVDSVTSEGKWEIESSEGMQIYNGDGENITGSFPLTIEIDGVDSAVTTAALIQHLEIDSASVDGISYIKNPETGEITRITFKDENGLTLGTYPPRQQQPEGGYGGEEGDNPSSGVQSSYSSSVGSGVNREHNLRQKSSLENRVNDVISDSMNGLEISHDDFEEIINLAKNEPQAAKNKLLNSIGFDKDELAVFNALETKEEKFNHLKDYYVSLGFTEEESVEKAESVLTTLSWLGNYSAIISDSDMEPAERIQYLIDEINLDQFTSQLIAGYILNDDGSVEELPSDYLDEVIGSINEFFENYELGAEDIDIVKDRIIAGLYMGDIILENLDEALKAITDEINERAVETESEK
ncbi:MAG: hypothetical protein P9M06_06945 [Candidatus Saelkia tenebricola]|nr:hypothetical protein [Candidatus Saelkia tenebricola]